MKISFKIIIIFLILAFFLKMIIETGETKNPYHHIDYRLVGYYNNFKNEALRRGKNPNPYKENLIIKITPDLKSLSGKGVRGLSSKYEGSNKRIEIEINALTYDTMSRSQIEVLLFHELGHGLLNLDHTLDSGIMDPRKYKYTLFKDTSTRKRLIDNLFALKP